MKRFLKYVVCILVVFFIVEIKRAGAQPPPPPPPVEIPIDGGLTFLIVAGLVYGAKKLNDNKEILQNE